MSEFFLWVGEFRTLRFKSEYRKPQEVGCSFGFRVQGSGSRLRLDFFQGLFSVSLGLHLFGISGLRFGISGLHCFGTSARKTMDVTTPPAPAHPEMQMYDSCVLSDGSPCGSKNMHIM